MRHRHPLKLEAALATSLLLDWLGREERRSGSPHGDRARRQRRGSRRSSACTSCSPSPARLPVRPESARRRARTVRRQPTWTLPPVFAVGYQFRARPPRQPRPPGAAPEMGRALGERLDVDPASDRDDARRSSAGTRLSAAVRRPFSSRDDAPLDRDRIRDLLPHPRNPDSSCTGGIRASRTARRAAGGTLIPAREPRDAALVSVAEANAQERLPLELRPQSLEPPRVRGAPPRRRAAARGPRRFASRGRFAPAPAPRRRGGRAPRRPPPRAAALRVPPARSPGCARARRGTRRRRPRAQPPRVSEPRRKRFWDGPSARLQYRPADGMPESGGDGRRAGSRGGSEPGLRPSPRR